MEKVKLDPLLYPECKSTQCPFCGCMGDNTCKLHNVIKTAPHMIRDHGTRIEYCDRPKQFLELLNIKTKNKLSPAMEKAIETLKKGSAKYTDTEWWSWWSVGTSHISTRTMNALKRRGLVEVKGGMATLK